MSTEPEPIGHVEFVDGSSRPVFLDGERQFVYGDSGERVYGEWYLEPEQYDIPQIVGPDVPPFV